jgi:uncharacterized protein (DUF1778 family)
MTNKNTLKRGRPEMSEEEKRSVITQFRCTSEERELLEKAAEISGKKVSDWLREQAIRAARRSV